VQIHLGKKCGAKSAVGGAKNGGRGLEKKPYPVKMAFFLQKFIFFKIRF